MTSWFSFFKGGISEQNEEGVDEEASREMTNRISFFEGGSSGKNEDGVDSNDPFAYYLARQNIPFVNNHLPPESSTNRRTSDHPIYSVMKYDWEGVLERTQNRARANFLGRGSFGPVYRCDLTATTGAVKFQDLTNRSGDDEFMAEIIALHNAKHHNVIKLIGTSFGLHQLALIYEFMPNGSLDHHILPNMKPGPGLPQNNPVLSWERRMSIAAGVARALRYVHTELNLIHRDVKLANVLLDQNFTPKLGDFGMAVKVIRNANGTEIHRKISPAVGTRGCAAPETVHSDIYSTKSDVYGYGVLLLQLFTARQAYDPTDSSESGNLTALLRPYWANVEEAPLLIDAKISDRYSVLGLREIFRIARRCTHPQAHLRPDMDYVMREVHKAVNIGISRRHSFS